MRSLLFVALVACGCGRDSPPPRIVPPDAGPPPYQEDTPCGIAPGGGAGICNPLTQTGCNPGCKCGWIQDTQATGHVGCNPQGHSPSGEACNTVFTGGDSCARKGDVCIDAVCRAICDHRGGDPMCAASTTCTLIDHVFTDGTNTIAGLCLP